MGRRPRVALVAWDAGPAGTPIGMSADIVTAGRERFDFVVISSSLDPALAPLVTWRRARTPESPFRARWAVFYATAAIQVARARADVVHTIAPAPLIPNRVDLATVNFCHAGFHAAGATASRPARALTLGLERWAYGHGRTRVIEMETAAAAETFRRHYPAARVEVLPRRYDLDRYRPDENARAAVRGELGAAPDEVVALFAGRDHRAKGLRFAIEGLARARRAVGSPLTLWAAGYRDDPCVRRMAAGQGVADHVRPLGWREDMQRLYAGADMLVLPSLYEQGSRASHEAAACGLPLVATPVHGAAALIGDDEGGIRVSRDGDSVGSAIARLAADPDLRERMGRTARERCAEVTGGADHIAGFLDLYDRLAA